MAAQQLVINVSAFQITYKYFFTPSYFQISLYFFYFREINSLEFF